jgi:SAM-dependent methyltransferase
MQILKRLARRVAETLGVKGLFPPFVYEPPHGWVAHLPRWEHLADAPDDPMRSTLVLYEDGRPLGPPHTPHPEVRSEGLGRYSHWQEHVYFSTSDNSDPNHNGRAYTLSVAAEAFDRLMLRWRPSNQAVNEQQRDSSPEALNKDVDWALSVGRMYLRALPDGEANLRGKTVLEVGPGINYGSVLYLACHDAKVAVADRFLAAWRADYHGRFYAMLRDRLRQEEPELDVTPLERLLRADGYDEDVIACHPHAIEDLPAALDSHFDLVVSNAVLEHVFDLPAACRGLHRITRPGGIGLHEVDFRDHRNYARPLEYLLLDDDRFRREFWSRNGECGNRHRPGECTRLMELAGFTVIRFTPTLELSAPQHEYLRDFLPRLQQAKGSRYADYPLPALQPITGFYVLRSAG